MPAAVGPINETPNDSQQNEANRLGGACLCFAFATTPTQPRAFNYFLPTSTLVGKKYLAA